MGVVKFLNSKAQDGHRFDPARFFGIWSKLRRDFDPKRVIHVIGTNGKGSTSRALAVILHNSNKKVGHFSSPHLHTFNERIWINGFDVSDTELQAAYEFLEKRLCEQEQKEISYFEFATLLALRCFDVANCEFVVLEAGLGGEFDSTNAVQKELSIVTPIDYDHQDVLGNSLKEITLTKIRSIKNKAVVSHQHHQTPKKELIKYMRANNHELIQTDNDYCVQIKQWCKNNNVSQLFVKNFCASFLAAIELGIEPTTSLLNGYNMPARMQKIAPNITVDVGHNELAAREILKYFIGIKVYLVYNSKTNKKIIEILEILKPIIDKVMIMKHNSNDMLSKEELTRVLDEQSIEHEELIKIDKKREYLVFGSFGIVKEFLEGDIIER